MRIWILTTKFGLLPALAAFPRQAGWNLAGMREERNGEAVCKEPYKFPKSGSGEMLSKST
jgi:hypothetical protein